MNRVKRGITIAELIGVFAMLGVLCAAVAPHLIAFDEASRLSKLRFNLEKLRQRIDEYRQRTGKPPTRLRDAFEANSLLDNPLSNAAPGCRSRVKLVYIDPPTRIHATKSGLGGWLYNPNTGGVWADSSCFLHE